MAKNMLISFKKYLFPILILFVASCAQQVAPSGGPKDEKHPKFTDSKPSNKSVKFPISGQKITIKFDEFVRLKDASQQIVISPPPPGENGPTILENGKNIEILFNEGLERNTTYTINFGNVIFPHPTDFIQVTNEERLVSFMPFNIGLKLVGTCLIGVAMFILQQENNN